MTDGHFMKRIPAIALIALLAIALTACGGSAEPDSTAMQDDAAVQAPAEEEVTTQELGETNDSELVETDDADDVDTETVELDEADAGDAETDAVELDEADEGDAETDAIELAEADDVENDADMTLVAEGAPSTPVFVRIFMDRAPAAGEQARISLHITTAEDVATVNADFELPEGVRVVDGEVSWSGPLTVDETAELTAVLVFDSPGEYTINGVALAPINADMVYGDMAQVFLTVGEETGSFGLDSAGEAVMDADTTP